MYTTLISTATLADKLDDPSWVIIDCRFNLTDTEAGRRAYQQGHIPGALYAHLDEDLSGPIHRGKTGRHPLPNIDVLALRFERWGIGRNVQVVAYDDAGGMIAARLWWLLRWLGHDAVAVLDGGWQKWVKEERFVESIIPRPKPRAFIPSPRSEMLVFAHDVDALRQQNDYKIVDSRAPERYRGEEEPLDPVAGHIPGVLNIPHPEAADEEGQFLKADKQKKRFRKILGDTEADHTIFYCGSGVSACRNLLAYKHAGLGDAKLYAGSWSEWITNPEREVATGR